MKGAEDGSQQCILSYIAPNYVGFRRITVSHDWHFATGPALKLDSEDCDGFCTFLSTEAFVTWDDDILIRGSEMLCRAVLATPLTMKPYEVSMTKSKAQTRPHATSNCNTTYPRPEDAKYNNPICGVILHGAPAAAATSDAGPDSPMATTMPLYYTLVRMSATATSPLSWWETNLPDAPRPRWAETIQNRIDVSVPADFPDPRLLVDEDAEKTAGRVRWNDDGDDVDADSDDEDADSEVDDYDAYGSVDDEDDMEGDSSAQHGEPASPTDERLVSLGDDEPPSLALAPTQLDRDVHPYRAVIWGLAAVPGMKTAAAGASAVLVTRHLGHWPEREPSWKTSTSKVLFTSVPMVSEGADVEQPRRRVVGGGPSTEARVWAWMYGGGLPVPGVAAYGDGGGVIGSLSTQVEDDVNADDMATAATLLASVAASQRAAGCVFCASPLEPVSDRRKARCARLGHTFDVCAATDLVITSPGTSRACAVCGARCLGVEHVIAVARQHRVQQQQEGPQTSGGDAESVRSKGRGKGARRAGGKGKGKARSSVANNEPEAEAGEQALQRLEDLIQLTITGDRCGGCGGRFVD